MRPNVQIKNRNCGKFIELSRQNVAKSDRYRFAEPCDLRDEIVRYTTTFNRMSYPTRPILFHINYRYRIGVARLTFSCDTVEHLFFPCRVDLPEYRIFSGIKSKVTSFSVHPDNCTVRDRRVARILYQVEAV